MIPVTPDYMLHDNSFRAAYDLVDPVDSQRLAVIIGK
jgi:hypothetical protein